MAVAHAETHLKTFHDYKAKGLTLSTSLAWISHRKDSSRVEGLRKGLGKAFNSWHNCVVEA
jgi:hypothetical protein